jgi:hypothetical protein
MIRLGSGVLYSRLAGNIEVSKWHWQTQDRRLFSVPQKVRTEKVLIDSPANLRRKRRTRTYHQSCLLHPIFSHNYTFLPIVHSDLDFREVMHC